MKCHATAGRGKTKRVVWEADVVLTGGDMRRIGVSLADLFCTSLESGQPKAEEFRSESKSIIEAA